MEDEYLIWSEEHGAWWLPERMGYTRHAALAGRYPQKEAEEIVLDANKHLPADTFNELMFPTIWIE